jgi:hypothetical protein
MMSKANKDLKKKELIRANFSRSVLYLGGFVTEKENVKIHERLMKFQEKHKIEVTDKDLASIFPHINV